MRIDHQDLADLVIFALAFGVLVWAAAKGVATL